MMKDNCDKKTYNFDLLNWQWPSGGNSKNSKGINTYRCIDKQCGGRKLRWICTGECTHQNNACCSMSDPSIPGNKVVLCYLKTVHTCDQNTEPSQSTEVTNVTRESKSWNCQHWRK